MALLSALLRVLDFGATARATKRRLAPKPAPIARGRSERLEQPGAADPIATSPASFGDQGDRDIGNSEPTDGTGRTYEIEYRDAYGEVTVRRVHLKRLYRAGDRIFLEAWCGVRGRDRTFRADRIQRLVTEAGKAIASPVQFFARTAPEILAESQSHKRTMTKAVPGLKALLWITRTGHEIDDAEEAVLLSYIDQRVSIGRSKLDHSWQRDLALGWIYDAAPTRGKCLSALRRMSGGLQEVAVLRDHADRIISSSGTFDEKKEKRRRQLMKAVA